MIDKTHELPVVRQVQRLDLSRSSVYYLPQPTPESDLRLMRRIDELLLEHPFAGTRMLRDMLRLENAEVGRKHVSTRMKKMGIEALYRKANTRRRNQAHRIYPCLLRGLTIDRPNQVWAMDTTYIPMQRGFVYLSAVLDYGPPEIMNTDQGSPFTRSAVIRVLEQNRTASRSAWRAKAAGAITSLLNACGNP